VRQPGCKPQDATKSTSRPRLTCTRRIPPSPEPGSCVLEGNRRINRELVIERAVLGVYPTGPSREGSASSEPSYFQPQRPQPDLKTLLEPGRLCAFAPLRENYISQPHHPQPNPNLQAPKKHLKFRARTNARRASELPTTARPTARQRAPPPPYQQRSSSPIHSLTPYPRYTSGPTSLTINIWRDDCSCPCTRNCTRGVVLPLARKGIGANVRDHPHSRVL
jgi:hypothetical protein